jgi:hypothetical protein
MSSVRDPLLEIALERVLLYWSLWRIIKFDVVKEDLNATFLEGERVLR